MAEWLPGALTTRDPRTGKPLYPYQPTSIDLPSTTAIPDKIRAGDGVKASSVSGTSAYPAVKLIFWITPHGTSRVV